VIRIAPASTGGCAGAGACPDAAVDAAGADAAGVDTAGACAGGAAGAHPPDHSRAANPTEADRIAVLREVLGCGMPEA
jgi:hypothetical protein